MIFTVWYISLSRDWLSRFGFLELTSGKPRELPWVILLFFLTYPWKFPRGHLGENSHRKKFLPCGQQPLPMSKRDRVTAPNESLKHALLFQSHAGKKRMRFVIRLSSTSMTSSNDKLGPLIWLFLRLARRFGNQETAIIASYKRTFYYYMWFKLYESEKREKEMVNAKEKRTVART